MNENFSVLFQYLKKERIVYDKSEFIFQIKSHPDYPSLLSITDALSFFGIQNNAVRVNFTQLYLLPANFIAPLLNENSEVELYCIESKANNYFITENKNSKEISKDSLELKWQGIALFLEKPDSVIIEPKIKKSKLKLISPTLCVALFLFILYQFKTNFLSSSFFVVSFIGFLFSIAALKDLFGTKSELINGFCNMTSTTSCSDIVNSNKWRVFDFFTFSDLSIIFFSSQICGLFLFILTHDLGTFFYIQEILLFCSLPIILLSLYYQKFVEKIWCPICLAIIGVLLIEILLLKLFIDKTFSIKLISLLLLIIVSLFISIAWINLKKVFSDNKNLKEIQFIANRFQRNYEIFKNSLYSNVRKELPLSPIILGNKESKLQICLITHPFCGFCESAHEILERILEKHKEYLQIKIIFRADIYNEVEKTKSLLRNLTAIYLQDGNIAFREAMNAWFKNKNVDKWLELYPKTLNVEEIDKLLNLPFNWCITNDTNFTPAIFINGYQYPKAYERDNLEYFIAELLEDNKLLN